MGAYPPTPPGKMKSIFYKWFSGSKERRVPRLDRKKNILAPPLLLDKFLCMPLIPSICSRVYCTAHVLLSLLIKGLSDIDQI